MWVLLIPASVNACEICGCGSGTATWGINPGLQRHFIGIRTDWRFFKGLHPDLSDQNLPYTVKDRFTTHEIIGRYNWKKGLQFSVVIPYKFNYRYESEHYEDIKGIGDISMHLHWLAVKPGNNKWKHALMLSAGMELPTGKFEFSHEIPSTFQVGSGSLDQAYNVNYTLRNSRIGFNLEYSYRINGDADKNFSWGDGFNGVSRLMYLEIDDKNEGYIASVGISYDWSDVNLENKRFEIVSAYSGGELISLQSGIDFYTNNAAIGAEFGIPLAQEYADGLTNLQAQFNCKFLYFINKKQKSTK